MNITGERLGVLLSGFFVLFITIFSPQLLTLQGVAPCWGILWLLPLSLENGKVFGILSGLGLGLLLDAISLGLPTNVPALILLGFWWGTNAQESDLGSFNLGLFAFLGSIFYGLTICLQMFFLEPITWSKWFSSWALHTLLAQSILTGLLAPMICSWILLSYRSRK